MGIDNKIREDLWKNIQAHYEREDYTEAVRDAVFCLSELLREKSGIEDKDGSKLVESTLMGKNPIIMVNKNETTTEKDIQQGIAFSAKGIMQSIRNPLSHEKISYTFDETEAIILYINFLLNQIDHSGGTTKIDDIMELLFDEDFTDTEEYADLLLKEIPVKKRFDLLLELYYRRYELPQVRLQHFIIKLFESLTKVSKSDFIRIVSKSLMKCKDDKQLRMYFHYFMTITYKDIDKLAQLRIENLILRSVENGTVEYQNDINTFERKVICNQQGALATWIASKNKFNLLSNRKELLEKLLYNLFEEDLEYENYVFEYFKSVVFDSKNGLNKRQINSIKASLNSGDDRYADALFFDMELLKEESPWYELFKDEYDNCIKINDSDSALPF